MNYNNNKFKYIPPVNNNSVNNNKNGYNNSNKQNMMYNATNNNMNKNYQANNRPVLSNFASNNNKNNNNDDEDDDLDISDSELIRASQAVESQLKFTNNVHHTTSNAMNIFSQFNSTTQPPPILNSTSNNLMPPPSTTTLYSGGHNDIIFSQNSDDLQSQVKQLKTENMQKDGEVKILRDKLKRMEQDSQRMRVEREELFKKLQQQQDEAKRALQKQIDIKELENQLKSQEIVDLTMKYKVLESTVKRNPNNNNNINNNGINVQSSQHFDDKKPQIHQSHFDNNIIRTNQPNSNNNLNKAKQQQQPNQQLIVSKGASIKRHAQDYQSSVDFLIDDDDDDLENFQFYQENKRPALSSVENSSLASINLPKQVPSNTIITSNAIINNPVNFQSSLKNQSPFSNNSIIQPTSNNNKQILQNTTNLQQQVKPIIAKPQINNNNSIIKTSESMPKLFNQQNKLSFENQLKSNAFKRNCILNTKYKKNYNNKSENLNFTINNTIISKSEINKNDQLYELTDLIAESTNYLFKFNSSNNEKISNSNITNVNKKLTLLYDYIKKNFKSTSQTNSTFLFSFFNIQPSNVSLSSGSLHANTLPTSLIIERIDFVINRLNEEIVKLINYLLYASSLAQENNTISNKQPTIKPADSFSIIDLLCLAFDIYFNLFLFRVSYFLIDSTSYNKNQSSTNNTNKVNKKLSNLNYFLITKLTKMKMDFFLVISTLLKSINFLSYTSTNNGKTSSTNNKNFNNKLNSDNLISTATNTTTTPTSSFSSYSTLKILNKILDCFNLMLFLPNLNQILEPDSFSTSFYTSLVDNMHNIFKKMNLIKIIKQDNPIKKSIYTKQESNEVVMIEDSSCENNDLIDQVIVEYGSDKDKSQEYDEEDEDDSCLFELFYQKLTKYFGDIVYALELNEIRQMNDDSNNHSNKSNQMSHTHNQSDQMEIITTIAADNDRKNIDFKLENGKNDLSINSPKLSSSRSQSDLQFELQSQIPIDEEKKNKFDLINNNKGLNTAVNNTNNNQSSINSSSSGVNSKSIDYVHSHAIQFLQIEFLTKFIHYMHNFELYSSLENKLIYKSQYPNKIITNNQKCLCYKDMLASYLILIDYKFNEKFINGARMCFDELFKMPISSFSSYLNDNINTNLGSYFQDSDQQLSSISLSNQLKKSTEIQIINKIESNLLNRTFQNNEITNRFIYLLIIKSCNVFLALFNNNEKTNGKFIDSLSKSSLNITNKGNEEMNGAIATACISTTSATSEINLKLKQQKLKFLKSIKDDYRLKNFFCLYSLAESNFDDFLASIKMNGSFSSSNEFNKSNSFDHLNTCLSSFKNSFKFYIDELIQTK